MYRKLTGRKLRRTDLGERLTRRHEFRGPRVMYTLDLSPWTLEQLTLCTLNLAEIQFIHPYLTRDAEHPAAIINHCVTL